MGDDSPNKKKFIIAGLASILLVAAVVAVSIGITRRDGSRPSTATKAVQDICSPTDYKETCEKSLAHADTTDPKELIQLAFDATVKKIGHVLKNSALLKEAAADQSTKDAFTVCEKVLENAVDDLKRSIGKIGEFDATQDNEFVEDLRTWLSAVVGNEETCLEAFEETKGDTGEKMKELLRSAREMSSNGLAMVSDASSLLKSLQLGGGRRLFATRRLLQDTKISLKPSIVVAQDGSGQFKSVGAAIASLPKKTNQTTVIYVKAGLYKEQVVIPKYVNNVVFIGDGPDKTRITGNKCVANGVKTFQSATVAVEGEGFLAKDIAFENTAGPDGGQAVALRVSGDKSVFFNVALDGYQDTLYAHSYRQYYRDCTISGTVDFIFGHSLTLLQNCKFIVRKPGKGQGCMITAEGRVDPRSNGGLVIQNGNITAEEPFLTAQPPHKAFLGRPWKELSRTIIIQSNIEGFIHPTGWSPWAGNFALDTCYYAEYDNRGAGSNKTDRVKWKGYKNISTEEVQKWTGGIAFVGDEWIKEAGVPYVPSLMQI